MPPYQSSNVAKLALLAQATERKEQKLGWPLGGIWCECRVRMQLCVYRTLSFVSFLHPAAAIDCVCSRDGDHVAPDFREHATLGSLFFLRR